MKDFKRSIIAALIIFVVPIACSISKAFDHTTEGIVVDKRCYVAYTTITYTGPTNNRIAMSEYHPERYEFTIEGDKDGKTVQYTFDVTETLYKQYSIGDYFTM